MTSKKEIQLYIGFAVILTLTASVGALDWYRSNQKTGEIKRLIATREQFEAEARKIRAEAELYLQQVKRDGQGIIEKAKTKAKSIITQSENLKLANDKELHKRFPGQIIKIEHPVTQINERYVESVIFGRTVDIRMVNKASFSIQPKFKIRLIDQYGFLTDEMTEEWWVDTIGSGEIRIENHYAHNRFGPPVYLAIEFLE